MFIALIRNQWDDKPTSRLLQTTLNVGFGIIAPILCFCFDPGIFRSGFRPLLSIPIFSSFSPFAYTAAGIGMIGFIWWLSIRKPISLLAGWLFGSGLFAFGVGVLLLPFSLIGLMFLIGIFGFLPFMTAFVFFANAWRATYFNREQAVRQVLLFTFGLVIALGVPSAVQWSIPLTIQDAFNQVQSDDESTRRQGIQTLKTIHRVISIDQWLKDAIAKPTDLPRLNEACQEVMGISAEQVMNKLND